MSKNLKTVVYVLIVLVVVALLVFITIKGKNSMNESQVAKAGDTVSMNYTGTLADGTVFDSNVDSKFGHVQAFEFTLGAGQVIPGWDKGILGMKVGEKKHLVISPEDAYGATGVVDPSSGTVLIPPNATLTFDVELVGITNNK